MKALRADSDLTVSTFTSTATGETGFVFFVTSWDDIVGVNSDEGVAADMVVSWKLERIKDCQFSMRYFGFVK